jgi:hypothetical protein
MTRSWGKNLDLGRFFRRHNRLLTFAGALIVFVTFLVKEGKRESLKDLADSVDAAESVFVIRSDNFTTPVQLARVEDKIDKVGQDLYRNSKIKDMDMKDIRFFMHFAEPAREDVMFLRASKTLDNASRLFEKLPRRPRLIEVRIHVLNSMGAKYRPFAKYGTGTVSLSVQRRRRRL